MKSFLFVCIFTSGAALAQTARCGLTSVEASKDLIYPPIARAAHVSGTVILLAEFELDGHVGKMSVVSGPEMLKMPAQEYVSGWKANEYGGSRTCPIVISFQLNTDKPSGGGAAGCSACSHL